MATRESNIQNNVPADGTESIPYADHKKLANGYMKFMPEAIMLEGVGAGGVGVTFTIGFEPAYLRVSEVTGPLLQEQWFTTAGVTGINCIDGTAAAVDCTILDNGDGTWNVVCPTLVAPDADTVRLLVLGVPVNDAV